MANSPSSRSCPAVWLADETWAILPELSIYFKVALDNMGPEIRQEVREGLIDFFEKKFKEVKKLELAQ